MSADDLIERGWLLMKRGLYERPEHMGYTGIRDNAGRLTEEDARSSVGDGGYGVTMVRVEDAPEFTDACFDDLARKHLQDKLAVAAATIASLKEENARLVKALAFADEHSAKIEALLEPHIKWECASEGCDKPATVHFERGGVGSYYCRECYMRIQARALIDAGKEKAG